jgi:hypothetical protein
MQCHFCPPSLLTVQRSTRLVKRSSIPSSEQRRGSSLLHKRTLTLGTTIAPVSTGPVNGIGSAVSSLGGASQVNIPHYNNWATQADVPRVTEKPKEPEIKGEALELHKKWNPEMYSNRRTMYTAPATCWSCHGTKYYHADLETESPWSMKHFWDLAYGTKAQGFAKLSTMLGSTAVVGGCLYGTCKNARAIEKGIGKLRDRVVALPSKTINAAKRAGRAGLDGVKQIKDKAFQRLSQKADLVRLPHDEEISTHHTSMSHAVSHTSLGHPSKAQLPQYDGREPMRKASHAMELAKRDFEEESHRVRCSQGGRCSLFDYDTPEQSVDLQHTQPQQDIVLSTTSSHALAALPVLSIGFALTVGSIWLSLTLAKRSQIDGHHYQPLLFDSKGQDTSSAARYRPALLLFPLASTLATVSLGSVYALKQSSLTPSLCPLVSYSSKVDLDDAADFAPTKRMSPRGKKVLQSAAVLGVSAGAAATSFVAIKALIGSPPPVEMEERAIYDFKH